MSFAEGTEVTYKNMQGVIGFVGDSYIVFEIATKEGCKSPGLLVYRENYKNIHILKASEK